MSKWILLMIVLLPSVAFSQAVVSGKFNITGNFQIGTNVIDGGIQTMKGPSSIVTGGGLVAAYLVPKGTMAGDDPQHASTIFDLCGGSYMGTNFNLTCNFINGITNQAPYGVAGTNQVGLVGVPSLNFSTNTTLISRIENIDGVGCLFAIPNSGIPTNGGMTIVMLTRGRMLGTTYAGGLSNRQGTGGGNANQIQFVSYQASATATKLLFSSSTNDSTALGSLTGATSNRWQFELVSFDGSTVTRMNNIANSQQTAKSFGTNFSLNCFCIGSKHSGSYANRYNGDWAGALLFTNSMSDGLSRTNVLNWLNNIYHFY